MSKHIVELDQIINESINEVFSDSERINQKKQFAIVKQLGLHVKDDKEKEKKQQKKINDKDFEESDEENNDTKKQKDDVKKITNSTGKDVKLTGDPKKLIIRKKEADKTDEIPGTPTSKKLHDPSNDEITKPDFKSIANNINLLRGGKSLKNPDVKDNIKQYIKRLNPKDRSDFLIYLNSLAQIMAGKKSGKDVAISAPEIRDEKQKLAIDTKIKNDKKQTKNNNSNVIIVGD